jgi:hypothetical protein
MDVKSTEKKSKKKDKRLDDDALITAEPNPKKDTKKIKKKEKQINDDVIISTESKPKKEKQSSDDPKTEPVKPTRCYNKKIQKPEEGSFNVIKGPIYCYF